jgi:hypothetical protein
MAGPPSARRARLVHTGWHTGFLGRPYPAVKQWSRNGAASPRAAKSSHAHLNLNTL